MTKSKKQSIPLKRKGIYILPNLFTIASLLSGFYAIVASVDGRFTVAAIAIFIAMVLDALDGRVARLINAQSSFGAELDSLSDMVSFGVGSALIMFNFALVHLKDVHLEKLGWLAAFIYVSCVAIRLARFNISAPDKRYFQGLPCPAAAGVLMSFIWVGSIYGWHGMWLWITSAVITVCLGLLQVSNVPYRSFKDINMSGRVKVTGLIAVVIVLCLIAIRPAEVLAVIFWGFALSGIYLTIYRFVRRQLIRIKKHG